MRKTVYILLFCILYAGSVSGQNFSVRSGGKELIESEPNRAITSVFRVTNGESVPLELISEVVLPEGWKNITPEFPYTLRSNSSDIRLVSIYIPGSATVGTYQITYRVMGREFPEISDQYTIDIVVLPVIRLDVQLLNAPQYVIAGERYTVVFRVTNFSNIKRTVQPTIQNRTTFRLKPEDAFLTLKPGEFHDIVVSVDTEAKTFKSVKHYVQCSIQTNGTKKDRATATSAVEVLPRLTDTSDRYHQLPIHLYVRNIWQIDGHSETGLQGEIFSEGTLDEAGTKHIEFRLRGPDIYDTSYLAEHDEYRASFQTNRLAIHAGDRNYTLSPLTQQYRYGRGIEANFQQKRFRFGGYFHQTRWIIPSSTQFASFIAYETPSKCLFKLNYLKKKFDAEGWSDTYSFDGSFHPFDGTNVQLEAAGSVYDGKGAPAFRLVMRGDHKWIQYNGHIIRADTDYKGYYRDTKLTSFSLSMEPVKRFRINAGYRHQRQNFDADTTKTISPYTEYARIGAYYRLTKRTHITLDWIHQRREDRMPVPMFRYGEKTLRMGVSHTIRMFNLYVSGEIGRTENDLLQQTNNTKKFMLSALYKPGTHLSFNGYLYYDENHRTIEEDKQRLTLGLRAFMRILEQSDLQIHYQSNHSPEEYFYDRNVFEVQFHQILWKKHHFSLRARHTLLRNSMENDETAVLLEYSVVLGVPVARKKSIGTIRGTVYDAQTYEVMEDIILRLNGSAAVTDHRGAFLFPPLKPGTYFLNIDRGGLGLDRVSAQKTPMEVNVEAGDDLNIELGITQSAKLEGNISVFRILENSAKDQILNTEFKSDEDIFIFGRGGDRPPKQPQGPSMDDELPEKTHDVSGEPAYMVVHGLGNVLVELIRDDEIQRRISDPFGGFVFEDIRPGTWTCRIVEANLPRYHRVEKNQIEITLEPGESKHLNVRVLPMKRRIRVLESGGNLVSQGAKRTERKDSDKAYQDMVKEQSHVSDRTTASDAKRVVHIVRVGDSLSRIAMDYFGDFRAYERIFDANRHIISDPNFILPGWKLNIPE